MSGYTPERAEAVVTRMAPTDVVTHDQRWTPRDSQKEPAGDWNLWLLLAGRGFGKTRTGAEWINALATKEPGSRFALIGATAQDARAVMVEGESGLLAVNPTIIYEPSLRRLRFPGGSTALLFSAEEPDTLRGPNFHYAWGDEVARWPDGKAALDTLRMGLRLGQSPRLLLTTTPRPLRWLKTLSTAAGVVTTGGRTGENAQNLPVSFITAMGRDYAGTRLGRQELDGEFIEEAEGALWTRATLEACRIPGPPPLIVRTVIGVDPPAGASATSDACGIIVAGLTSTGTAVVLADRSVQGLLPEGWARAVAAAYDEFSADLVVAEVNNGGAMVQSVLRAVAPDLNIKAVHASAGKVARAEPVASLYPDRVHHAGAFPDLEDELCALCVGGGWFGAARSPDRADALVWALTELLLGKRRSEPTIRLL